MTSKAFAEYDMVANGVRIAVRREQGAFRQLLLWQPLAVATITDDAAPTEPLDEAWLRLPEDDARAIYEALGDYFGHAGHDVRALRKDYDAERGRVDRLIQHLTRGTA